jgi:hypothetical protein
MKRKAAFTEADVSRALRAAAKLGRQWAVEIEPQGMIRIVPHDPQKRSPAAKSGPAKDFVY